MSLVGFPHRPLRIAPQELRKVLTNDCNDAVEGSRRPAFIGNASKNQGHAKARRLVIRVIDVSEFTRAIPFQWWKTLKQEHGVTGAVIQAWGGGPEPGRQNSYWAQQSIGALDAFGNGGVASYVWPPRDIGIALNWMKAQAPEVYDLQRFVALDVEAGAGVSGANVRTVIHGGQVPFIYVSPGGWNSIMGHSQSFSHIPLWLAGYPNRIGAMHWNVPAAQHPHATVPATVDVGEQTYLPFGGWTEARGWQFDGTTPYRGETLDLNVFEEGVFGGDAPAEEDDMINLWLLRVEGDTAVWLSNLVHKWLITDELIMDELRFIGVRSTSSGRAFPVRQEFLDAIPLAEGEFPTTGAHDHE